MNDGRKVREGVGRLAVDAHGVGSIEVETADVRQLGIQSVEIAGEVLSALMRMPGPCRLAELARAVGMPSAKLHRYMVSLIRIGLATQDPVSGRYDLGPTALQLGLLGFSRFDLLRFAERTLADLVAATGETAMIAAWSPRGPSIVRLAEARHEFAGSVSHGHACPLTDSATGLVFAAFGNPEAIEPLMRKEIEQNKRLGRTGAPHDEAAFRARVDETRQAGVGTSVHAGAARITAVSAPVFDATGGLVLALSVFGQSDRLDVSAGSLLAQLVRSAADTLSRDLGARAAT